MKDKWTLVVGVILLSIGILLRIFSILSVIPYIVMVTGSVFKISYIQKLIKDKIYKPGFELLILASGLMLFFVGIYFRKHGNSLMATYYMVPGLLLKLLFIVIIIREIKTNRKNQNI